MTTVYIGIDAHKDTNSGSSAKILQPYSFFSKKIIEEPFIEKGPVIVSTCCYAEWIGGQTFAFRIAIALGYLKFKRSGESVRISIRSSRLYFLDGEPITGSGWLSSLRASPYLL